MSGIRILIHTICLFLLPVFVALFGISTPLTLALIVLFLLWRWLITLSTLTAPAKYPQLELETISASHFVEKVRWCMDRLGLEYVEKPCGGTLGAFFLGRTVPLLKFRSGAVRSSIGNSSEILRYLFGRYSAELGERAQFLAADCERLELEKKIDRCGADLQVWVYYHILPHRDLSLHVWGIHNTAIPIWQRCLLKLLFPLLRFLIRQAFRISKAHHDKAVEHIDTLLFEIDSSLEDGRKSILGGEQINYTDLSFAAIMALWLQPDAYGGGKAESVRIERSALPPAMRGEIERWSERYPRSARFIETLYRTERMNPGSSGDGVDESSY